MHSPSDRKREKSAVCTKALCICCTIAAAGVVLVGMFLIGARWQRRSVEMIDRITEEATQHSERVETDVSTLRGDVAELQGKLEKQTGELSQLREKLTQLASDQLPRHTVEGAEPADENRETVRLLKLIPVEVERGMMLDADRNREWREFFSQPYTEIKVEGTPFHVKDFGPDGLPELQFFEDEGPQP